jgi:hypothetical protein
VGDTSLPRLAIGAAAALAMIAPASGLAVLSHILLRSQDWDRATVWWVMAAATVALVVRLLIGGIGQRARAMDAIEAAVVGAITMGLLAWVDRPMTAIIAVQLVAGVFVNRRVLVIRAAAMEATRAALGKVATSTGEFVHALSLIRSSGQTEPARLRYQAALDHFHDVFNAQTRRVMQMASTAEITFAPVTIIAVVLVAGALLATPGTDVLAFLLLAPVVSSCVTTLSHPIQKTSGALGASHDRETPYQPSARDVIQQLRQRGLRNVVTAAVVAAVTHGVALALMVPVLSWLLRGARPMACPWMVALLAAAAVHSLALRRAIDLARASGVTVLRRLSHRIVDQILVMPPHWFTADREAWLQRLITRDVVAASGLFVHAIRPLISAGLIPATVLLTLIVLDWRISIPALLMAPVLGLAVRSLLRNLHTHRRWLLVQITVQAAGTAVLFTGSALVLIAGPDIPGLIALLALGMCFANPVSSVVVPCRSLQSGLAALRRIVDFLSVAPR